MLRVIAFSCVDAKPLKISGIASPPTKDRQDTGVGPSTHLPLDLSYTAVLRLYCMEAGFTEPRPEITYINESNLLLMAWLEQVPFFSSLQNRNHMDSILCISDSRF